MAKAELDAARHLLTLAVLAGKTKRDQWSVNQLRDAINAATTRLPIEAPQS